MIPVGTTNFVFLHITTIILILFVHDSIMMIIFSKVNGFMAKKRQKCHNLGFKNSHDTISITYRDEITKIG